MKNILKKITVVTACIVTLGLMQINAAQRNERAPSADYYACRCHLKMREGANAMATAGTYCLQGQLKNARALCLALKSLAAALDGQRDEYTTYRNHKKYLERTAVSSRDKRKLSIAFPDYYKAIENQEEALRPAGRRQSRAGAASMRDHRRAVESKRAQVRERNKRARRRN